MSLFRILLSMIVNGIPIGGLLFRGWSPATALALYWCETLVGSLLMIARIAIHWRLTRKTGHWRPGGDLVITTGRGGKRATRRVESSYLAEFAVTSLAFTIAHGLFVAAIFGMVLKSEPDWPELVAGVGWMSLAQVIGFLADLVTIGRWPFAYLKARSGSLLGRVGILHLALIGGLFVAAVSSRPTGVLVVFGALKTLVDVASLFPGRSAAPAEAPAWFLWMARRINGGRHWKTGQDPATWWRETTRAESERAEEDERVAEPGPGG